MTREEKINILKAIIQECEEYQWWRKATLSEIIEDLKQEPTAKNEKVDCEHTDCNNCVNHKYCDYEPTAKNDLAVDCISRAQVQTEIEMNASKYTIAKERGGMGQVEWSDRLIKVSDAVGIIRKLPSVTSQEPKWIPVSEELPELDVNINVYSKKNPIMVSKPVYISYKLDGRDYVCPSPCILHSNGHWYIDSDSLEDWVNLDDYDSGTDSPLSLEVTAWQPLPKPYKPESEG